MADRVRELAEVTGDLSQIVTELNNRLMRAEAAIFVLIAAAEREVAVRALKRMDPDGDVRPT